MDDDSDADYSTIQAAVDNATKGDTIRVYAGTFVENVLVNKSLDIEGNGSKETIIDGHNYSALRIDADWCNVSKCSFTGDIDVLHTAGIDIHGDHNTISQNEFWRNHLGIYMEGAHYNTITRNHLSSNMEGIKVSRFSDNNKIFNQFVP